MSYRAAKATAAITAIAALVAVVAAIVDPGGSLQFVASGIMIVAVFASALRSAQRRC